MKPFEETIKSSSPRCAPPVPTPEACAALLLEATPRVFRAVRMAIADLEAPALTIPQFRALQFVAMHSGASLSATAEFLGLTLPSTSKLVDQLVKRTMLRRADAQDDRRRIMLRITERGDALLKNAQEAVCAHLAGLLHQLGHLELASLQNTLVLLRDHFPSPATMGVEEHLGGSGAPSPAPPSRKNRTDDGHRPTL
jgi:DNA-binding MarR family transcriptional regulator